MNNLLPIAASCLLAGGAIGYVVGNNGGEDAATENVADKEQAPGLWEFTVGGALQLRFIKFDCPKLRESQVATRRLPMFRAKLPVCSPLSTSIRT